MWRSGLRARELRRRWLSWSIAGLNGMVRAMSSFVSCWTARTPGLLRWLSLRRQPIVRCGDEDCALFADCVGADVYPCCAAYGWRRLWRASFGGAAGYGGGDEG